MAKNTVNNIIKAIPDYIFKYLYISFPEKFRSPPGINNIKFICQANIKININIIMAIRFIFNNMEYIFFIKLKYKYFRINNKWIFKFFSLKIQLIGAY